MLGCLFTLHDLTNSDRIKIKRRGIHMDDTILKGIISACYKLVTFERKLMEVDIIIDNDHFKAAKDQLLDCACEILKLENFDKKRDVVVDSMLDMDLTEEQIFERIIELKNE
jgi:hypothetical protein